MKELIYRVMYKATRQFQCIVSFAGGRKTMSTDLQSVASIFGYRFSVNVLANTTNKDNGIPFETLIQEGKIIPVVSEGASASFLYSMKKDFEVSFENLDSFEMVHYFEEESKKAVHLYENESYGLNLSKNGSSSWRCLYLLPRLQIERMIHEIRFGLDPAREAEELQFLKKLPKTDLHCHLGGVARVKDLFELARANLLDSSDSVDEFSDLKKLILASDQNSIFNWIAEKTGGTGSLKNLRDSSLSSFWIYMSRFLLCFEEKPELLEGILFRSAKVSGEREFFHSCRGIGIENYEACGDLQGSTLLQTRKAIEKACEILLRQCREENIFYLELRCSPMNYTKGGLTPSQIVEVITDFFAKEKDLKVTLLFIASRHGKMSTIWQHVELAKEILQKKENILVGFDLAGDESKGDFSKLRSAFLDLMEESPHITIHAGETQDVKSIWSAVYQLNAERIGHGLKLENDHKLLDYFVHRKISVEMCPSSNQQIVGYQDNYNPDVSLPIYPLKQYLEKGLRVCVNTDNPGISCTSVSRELHRAARMTPGGLSLWDILCLVRNGFRSSFAKPDLRKKIYLDAERHVLDVVSKFNI